MRTKRSMSDVAHLMKTHFFRSLFTLSLLLSMFWTGSVVSGQTNTTVNLGTQARNPDFSALPVTRPVSVGTSLPSTCLVGQLFFNSSATAGNNLSSCTSANTWTPIGSGSGGAAGNATAIQGATVSNTAPGNNQTLVYNTSASSYVPTSIFTLQNGLGTSAAGASNLQVNVSMGVRAVVLTSDNIVNADCGGLVTYNNTSTVSVALPQPGLAGNFAAGCPITVRNYGAGTVTITPSSSTIGGAASQAVAQNKACLIVSDGSNWQLGNCN